MGAEADVAGEAGAGGDAGGVGDVVEVEDVLLEDRAARGGMTTRKMCLKPVRSPWVPSRSMTRPWGGELAELADRDAARVEGVGPARLVYCWVKRSNSKMRIWLPVASRARSSIG